MDREEFCTVRDMESSSCAVSKAKGKWEDLNIDLLHNIFQRVELDVKLFDLPLICKSWYQASMDPQIWQTLDFTNVSDISHGYDSDSDNERRVPRKILAGEKDSSRFKRSSLKPCVNRTPCVSIANLVQLAIKRSKGTATNIILCYFSIDTFSYVLQGCPGLKRLTMPSYFSNSSLVEILGQIKANCKNFEGLTCQGIGSNEASAIVTRVPDIKYLTLTDSVIFRETLMLILHTCRKLELLDVRNCVGFDAEDVEISKLASHIKTFISEGSVSFPPRDYLSDKDWCWTEHNVWL